MCVSKVGGNNDDDNVCVTNCCVLGVSVVSLKQVPPSPSGSLSRIIPNRVPSLPRVLSVPYRVASCTSSQPDRSAFTIETTYWYINQHAYFPSSLDQTCPYNLFHHHDQQVFDDNALPFGFGVVASHCEFLSDAPPNVGSST